MKNKIFLKFVAKCLLLLEIFRVNSYYSQGFILTCRFLRVLLKGCSWLGKLLAIRRVPTKLILNVGLLVSCCLLYFTYYPACLSLEVVF